MVQSKKHGRGFILGKFMPPHRGHQLLIEFAKSFCENVTVLVCSLDREPISGEKRYRWMQEIAVGADVLHCPRDLPQEPSESPEFWQRWRDAIREFEPREIDYVFASESYGVQLAAELGARFIPFDVARQLCPVSATAIRNDPFANWQYLPDCVRPEFVKRVCIVGPESTGKSTLARGLAARFDTTYAWEHARPLLDLSDGRCTPADVPIIARSQVAIEQTMARHANRVLFCDTSLLLTKIWSYVLFDSCPDWIERIAQTDRYDLAILLDVDVPWVDDAQRYFPDQRDRERFFLRCRAELEQSGQLYVVIGGDFEQRLDAAVREVGRRLGLEPKH